MALTFDELSKEISRRDIIEAPIVAKKLNKSEETVRRWIKEGKIEGYKIGGRWFVKRQSIKSLVYDF